MLGLPSVSTSDLQLDHPPLKILHLWQSGKGRLTRLISSSNVDTWRDRTHLRRMGDSRGILRGATVRESPDRGQGQGKQANPVPLGPCSPWVMKHEDAGRKRQRHFTQPHLMKGFLNSPVSEEYVLSSEAHYF